MIFHEYDPAGWLVGWYEAEWPRPDSTPTPPTGIPPARARFVSGAWIEDASREILAERDQAQRQAVDLVQTRLDTLAQSWGYDNILSGASYAVSRVPRFKAEGEALSDFRDATWAAVAAAQDAPTLDAFLALLPPLPVRPVA